MVKMIRRVHHVITFAALVEAFDMSDLACRVWVEGCERWRLEDAHSDAALAQAFNTMLRDIFGTDQVATGAFNWLSGQFYAGWTTATNAALEQSEDETRQ